MPDELSLSLRARVALEAHGFHFTHSLGQNFLLDDHAVAEMATGHPGRYCPPGHSQMQVSFDCAISVPPFVVKIDL